MRANGTPLPKRPPEEVAERIAHNLPKGGLFGGATWRFSPEPFPLPEEFAGDLEQLGFRLHRFLRACNLLYRQSIKGTMPGWIAGILDAGKPPDVVELGRERAFLDQLPGVIRPDVILTSNGYVLSEIDSVPGGIGLTAWMNQAYEAEGFPVVGGARGMLDGFASLLPEGGDIFVSEEAASYRPEMEWLCGQLSAGSRFSWKVVGQDHQGPWAPVVYRFFEMFDLPNLPAAPSLLQEAKEGSIRLTAPPKAFLEEKLWFALFWLRPLESFWIRELGSRTFAALRKCIPRTWLLDPAPIPPQAVYPGLEIASWEELKHFSQRERHLLIKVSGFSAQAWGGRGITVGHDVPAPEWVSALEAALDGFNKQPAILQEFHTGSVHPVRYLGENGALIEFPARARLCPYFFAPHHRKSPSLGGILATLCPDDKKIIHGMTDAVLCPCSSTFPD